MNTSKIQKSIMLFIPFTTITNKENNKVTVSEYYPKCSAKMAEAIFL